MSRFRLYPTGEQDDRLRLYCSHARLIWNVAVEQMGYASRDRRMPGFAEQSRQLTQARREHQWLTDVPTVVGQQALRDFRQACSNWAGGTHQRPTWRKAGRSEGFRVTADHGRIGVERINGRWSRIWIPGLGWVRFRRTRQVPSARSFRVTLDASGRWHVAFAVVPPAVASPGCGEVIGVDRGVAVTLAYSDGTMLSAPIPVSDRSAAQALTRCTPGSNRRRAARKRLTKVRARNADRRLDFIEKATTDLARRADLVRVEDLRIGGMTRSARGTVEKPGRHVRQKAGLNRSILAGGWGMFVRRLEDKAPGRVEKVDPAFTSQRCSRCGIVDRGARESQAVFRCRSCGYSGNADVNAACNIAAGRAARGAGDPAKKRRPQRANEMRLDPMPIASVDVNPMETVELGRKCGLVPVGLQGELIPGGDS